MRKRMQLGLSLGLVGVAVAGVYYARDRPGAG